MTISRPTPRERRTHCVYGHEYTVENTILRSDGGRRCRTCQNTCRRGVRRPQKWRVVECTGCGDPRKVTDRTGRRILAGDAPTLCLACRANPLIAEAGREWMRPEERLTPKQTWMRLSPRDRKEIGDALASLPIDELKEAA